MKCFLLLAGAIAMSPASAQVTPPIAPVPQTPAATSRAMRAPRTPAPDGPDEAWRSDLDRQRVLEERQRQRMELDIERQHEREARDRELMQAQEERQREQMQEQMDRLREQEEQQRDQMRVAEERQRDRERDLADHAPAPWAHRDPADSLYRVAREALNRGDYRRAAQLFNDLTQRYPNSEYAYVGAYWEAFSRYRIGTTDELKAAERALRGLNNRSAPNNGWKDYADVNGLRTRIRGALAMRGDSDAADLVEQTARQAGSSCDQEDLMVRVEALNALSQMDAAAALPILRRVLDRKDECLVELRRRAVFMLARRGDSEGASILISTAKNDPNPQVRSEAISYLPRIPGDAGLAALEDVLRTSDDERIQRTAVRALMSADNPRARTSLRGLLERRDASEALRLQVLEAYSRDRNGSDDGSYLRSLYNRTDSERMKLAIIGALARIGGRDNNDWLAGLVRNTSESSQVRSAALQRLSRSDISIAEIGRMYDAADSRSMREQLIATLGSRKEPEATDKLIDIARNSTDLDMRRQAINCLSRKNDPRATKLLMELIEK